MALVDAQGRPIALFVTSAAPAEVTLVQDTLDALLVAQLPERMIGDKAYDSDALDDELWWQGIEMIAPNRRKRRKTQDGRKLRRYRRRWKVERLFAWADNFRRLVVRYDFYQQTHQGFWNLAALLILLRLGL